MRSRACATATIAFFGPRCRSTRRKRACSALFLARLAPAAASTRAGRSHRLPLPVVPDLCLPALSCWPGQSALGAPFVQEGCVQRAKDGVVADRAGQRADVVEDVGLHRILRLGGEDRLLPLLRDRSLLGGKEAGAEVDTSRAQH